MLVLVVLLALLLVPLLLVGHELLHFEPSELLFCPWLMACRFHQFGNQDRKASLFLASWGRRIALLFCRGLAIGKA